MRLTTRRAAAFGAAVALGLGGLTLASADSATGTNGFTPVTQTRVFDSTRIAGDALLASGQSQEINPNAITKGLVPAGATAVEIQITAAQETEVNGDLDVTPTENSHPGTSNLNFNKGVAVTSSTVAELGPNGEFWVYNHGGSAGSVRLVVDVLGYYAPTAAYQPPSTLTANMTTPETISTGGKAYDTATDVVELTFPTAGTYQVSVNAKATPPAGGTGSVQVYPNFYVYNQVISSTWAGDEFNLGSGALESGANSNIDSYFTGSGLVTVSAGEELHFYAGGYDSDTSAGKYTLDDLNVVAVPVTVPAS